MPLGMFRLRPGENARYRVCPVGGGERRELDLVVDRPEEGPSRELELRLVAPDGGVADLGRVPLDGGYLAVLREVRRQLDSVTGWRESKEFDLVPADAADTDGAVDAAELAERPAARAAE